MHLLYLSYARAWLRTWNARPRFLPYWYATSVSSSPQPPSTATCTQTQDVIAGMKIIPQNFSPTLTQRGRGRGLPPPPVKCFESFFSWLVLMKLPACFSCHFVGSTNGYRKKIKSELARKVHDFSHCWKKKLAKNWLFSWRFLCLNRQIPLNSALTSCDVINQFQAMLKFRRVTPHLKVERQAQMKGTLFSLINCEPLAGVVWCRWCR